MVDADNTSQTEGTQHVTDGTLIAFGPADQQTERPSSEQTQPYFYDDSDADDIPIWAARPGSEWNVAANLLAVPRVLVKPRSTFQRAHVNAWRIAIAVVSVVAIIRAAVYFMYESTMDTATPARTAIGTGAGILSPLAFIVIAAAALYTVNVAFRAGRSIRELLSFASLAATPILLRALAQTVAMGVNGEPVNPHGILGLIVPDAPTLLLRALAPIDFFGLWAVALVVVAAFVVKGQAVQSVATVDDNREELGLDAEAISLEAGESLA